MHVSEGIFTNRVEIELPQILKDDVDYAHTVPVRIEEDDGLTVSLLSSFDAKGNRCWLESPQVNIERHGGGWRIEILRHGGGDPNVSITIPDGPNMNAPQTRPEITVEELDRLDRVTVRLYGESPR